jgi:molybdopterin-guanine dinucleotide biosynthesis protein A
MNSATLKQFPDKEVPNFVAVLLAGGRSARMGRDKATLELDGRPLWRHQLETLLALRPARTLIATHPDQHLGSLPADVDAVPDHLAAGGALAALPRLLSDPLPHLPRLVIAIDMPGVDAGFLRRHFLDNINHGVGTVLIDEKTQLQPIPCLLTPDCLTVLNETLDRGELSLLAFCKAAIAAGALRTLQAGSGDHPYLENLNTPKDWQTFTDSR